VSSQREPSSFRWLVSKLASEFGNQKHFANVIALLVVGATIYMQIVQMQVDRSWWVLATAVITHYFAARKNGGASER